MWRADADRQNQTVLRRARHIWPPDCFNMLASTPASTSVCLSLQRWYLCRFGHSDITKGKIYQNTSGCAGWEESELCIAEVLGHKWEMTQVCVCVCVCVCTSQTQKPHHSLCPVTLPNQADNWNACCRHQGGRHELNVMKHSRINWYLTVRC